MRVIVAERDEETRKSLTQLLHTSGFEVTPISDSTGLLRACLKQEVDVVLLDLAIGPLTGVEAIGLVRDIDDQILVVPMAEEDKPSLEFAVRSLGIFYYLLKPVANDEVFAVLESAGRRLAPGENHSQLDEMKS